MLLCLLDLSVLYFRPDDFHSWQMIRRKSQGQASSRQPDTVMELNVALGAIVLMYSSYAEFFSRFVEICFDQ
jgi:hypothetical protein